MLLPRPTTDNWANTATCNLCHEFLWHVRTCQDWLQTHPTRWTTTTIAIRILLEQTSYLFTFLVIALLICRCCYWSYWSRSSNNLRVQTRVKNLWNGISCTAYKVKFRSRRQKGTKIGGKYKDWKSYWVPCFCRYNSRVLVGKPEGKKLLGRPRCR